MSPLERVRKLLRDHVDELGSSPDEVAGHLIKAGCRGVPGEPDACPVAQWLARHGAVGVQVTQLSVMVSDLYGEPLVSIYTSEAVRRFVEEFDAGGYPELDVRP